jgi:hypothetical protein
MIKIPASHPKWALNPTRRHGGDVRWGIHGERLFLTGLPAEAVPTAPVKKSW